MWGRCLPLARFLPATSWSAEPATPTVNSESRTVVTFVQLPVQSSPQSSFSRHSLGLLRRVSGRQLQLHTPTELSELEKLTFYTVHFPYLPICFLPFYFVFLATLHNFFTTLIITSNLSFSLCARDSNEFLRRNQFHPQGGKQRTARNILHLFLSWTGLWMQWVATVEWNNSFCTRCIHQPASIGAGQSCNGITSYLYDRMMFKKHAFQNRISNSLRSWLLVC